MRSAQLWRTDSHAHYSGIQRLCRQAAAETQKGKKFSRGRLKEGYRFRGAGEAYACDPDSPDFTVARCRDQANSRNARRRKDSMVLCAIEKRRCLKMIIRESIHHQGMGLRAPTTTGRAMYAQDLQQEDVLQIPDRQLGP